MGIGCRPTTRTWPEVGEMTPCRGPATPAQAQAPSQDNKPQVRHRATACHADRTSGRQGPTPRTRARTRLAVMPTRACAPDSEGNSAFRRPVLCPGATSPDQSAIAPTEPTGGDEQSVAIPLCLSRTLVWNAEYFTTARSGTDGGSPTAALQLLPSLNLRPTMKAPDSRPFQARRPRYSALSSAVPN